MDWIPTLQVAFAAGLATTFDDNIYLTGFFSEVNRTFRPKHVAVGELVGFSVLLAISLLGFAVGLVVSSEWIGLLGVLPILIGFNNLREHFNSSDEAEYDKKQNKLKYAKARGFESRRLTLWQILRDRQTYDVSAVTISNGGNNLGIYIPLFASLSFSKILLTIPVLYGFVITWLLLSFHLTRAPGIAFVLSRYGRLFFPFVLMWLGFRILNDSESYRLFF